LVVMASSLEESEKEFWIEKTHANFGQSLPSGLNKNFQCQMGLIAILSL